MYSKHIFDLSGSIYWKKYSIIYRTLPVVISVKLLHETQRAIYPTGYHNGFQIS